MVQTSCIHTSTSYSNGQSTRPVLHRPGGTHRAGFGQLPRRPVPELERIALDQRVSLAWVVREAVQSYLVTRWPLLEGDAAKTNIDESKEQ